jgi:hypothetical protein
MTTTAKSFRLDLLRSFRVTACVIFGLSTTLVFAEDGSPVRVTHVLGLEGIGNNAGGTLSIEKDALQFRKSTGLTAQISVGSITNVSLGEQDQQVGGAPMAVGRAAAPFGGGRVIGLFSHKKYDTLTVEYHDTNGGIHGAIFRMNKGKAQAIREALVADGAHLAQAGNHRVTVSVAELKNENK